MPVSRESASGMTPGDEPSLVQQTADEFCPRFTAGGEVWYAGGSRAQSTVVDEENFRVSDIELGPDNRMPDVIVKHAAENWILLIEAVISDPALDEVRRVDPTVSAGSDSLRPVYVAAFADRTAFRQHAMDIPWGTHVWIAAEPDHLVRFNGSKLLGPHV